MKTFRDVMIMLLAMACVFWLYLFATGFLYDWGFDNGIKVGNIQVASGQVYCELVEQKDKTTEWVCSKVELPN